MKITRGITENEIIIQRCRSFNCLTYKIIVSTSKFIAIGYLLAFYF